MAPVQPKGGQAAQLLVWAVDNWQAILAAVLLVALVQLAVFLRKKTRKPFLDPTAFKPLKLVDKTFLTHNTVRLRFALPHPDQRLGLPVGQHITFLAQDADGKDIYRPYTPVSDDDQLGSVDFVIKLYPEGKMSKVISAMKVGDTLPMKGPRGRFEYKPNMVLNIGAPEGDWGGGDRGPGGAACGRGRGALGGGGEGAVGGQRVVAWWGCAGEGGRGGGGWG